MSCYVAQVIYLRGSDNRQKAKCELVIPGFPQEYLSSCDVSPLLKNNSIFAFLHKYAQLFQQRPHFQFC